MNTNILMRIDFQNDFVHPYGALSLNNPELIERHQNFANALFSNTFEYIIDSYDTHFSETYSETMEAKKFPLHCVFNSWGWQQAAPFKPELKAIKIYKSTTNIWNEEKNYALLQQDWHNINVYLCGVLSDVCVKQAMDGLLMRGANVIIIDDLCQGAQNQMGDILMKNVYQPFVQEGKLKSITTAQFFRNALHDKKIQHNLVNKSLGE